MAEQLNYVSAVNAALHRAMRGSSDAILFGEDVAKPGGVFGATKGLHLDYGRRVFDTPISEAAILGAAVGAALRGKRPIVEIMWADFALVALDQLVNQAAGRVRSTRSAWRRSSPTFPVCTSPCQRRPRTPSTCCSRRSPPTTQSS